MRLVIDLEATCWETHKGDNEIIEIGAVCTDDNYVPQFEFQSFVKPILFQTLSNFCKILTSIEQEQVDAAPSFTEVMASFAAVVQEKADKRLDQLMFCSWGNYNKNQFERDCTLHKLPYPFGFHRNLKQWFSEVTGGSPCGLAKAMGKLRLEMDGTHHRGIDDARNITKVSQALVRKAFRV